MVDSSAIAELDSPVLKEASGLELQREYDGLTSVCTGKLDDCPTQSNPYASEGELLQLKTKKGVLIDIERVMVESGDAPRKLTIAFLGQDKPYDKATLVYGGKWRAVESKIEMGEKKTNTRPLGKEEARSLKDAVASAMPVTA